MQPVTKCGHTIIRENRTFRWWFFMWLYQNTVNIFASMHELCVDSLPYIIFHQVLLVFKDLDKRDNKVFLLKLNVLIKNNGRRYSSLNKPWLDWYSLRTDEKKMKY